MPQSIIQIAQEPVFSDADPYLVNFGSLGEYRMNDFEMRPPREDKINPQSETVIYLIETIARTAHDPTAGDTIRKRFKDAFDNNVIGISTLSEIMDELSTTYGKARERHVTKSTGLPTGAPQA